MVNQEFATGRRLTVATLAAGALQYAWIAFWWWYLKVPDSILCPAEPGSGGFFGLFENCPETRPYAGWVIGFIPFAGPILSFLTAVLLFRFPFNESRTWTRFLVGIPVFSVLALLGLLV